MSALNYSFVKNVKKNYIKKYKKSLTLADDRNKSKYREKFLNENDQVFYYSSHRPIVNSVFGVNVLIFMSWAFAKRYSWKAEMFLFRNFSLSAKHLEHGRFHTIFTSGFAHSRPWHVCLNMTALCGISVPLIQNLGWSNYLSYYLSTSTFVSLLILLKELFSKKKKIMLGASGAVQSLLITLLLIDSKIHSSFILLPSVNLRMKYFVFFLISKNYLKRIQNTIKIISH